MNPDQLQPQTDRAATPPNPSPAMAATAAVSASDDKTSPATLSTDKAVEGSKPRRRIHKCGEDERC